MVDREDLETIQTVAHRWEISADVVLDGDEVRIRVFAADPSQLGGFVTSLARQYALEVAAEGVEPGPRGDAVDNLVITAR